MKMEPVRVKLEPASNDNVSANAKDKDGKRHSANCEGETSDKFDSSVTVQDGENFASENIFSSTEEGLEFTDGEESGHLRNFVDDDSPSVMANDDAVIKVKVEEPQDSRLETRSGCIMFGMEREPVFVARKQEEDDSNSHQFDQGQPRRCDKVCSPSGMGTSGTVFVKSEPDSPVEMNCDGLGRESSNISDYGNYFASSEELLKGQGSNDDSRLSSGLFVVNKSHACDLCGATFTCQSQLKRHHLVHTGDRPFKCHCGATYRSSTALYKHKKNIHEESETFKCDKCGMVLPTRTKLKCHVKTHGDSKPFRCDECGARFASAFRLKYHIRHHTGEKPFKCGKCQAAFKEMQGLTRHLRVHTGEKPFKCDKCQAQFTDCSGLIRHRVVHSSEKPYKCDECSAAFKSGYTMKLHKRTHTGEKPYKCSECSVAYRWSKSLKLHMRIHTGEQVDRLECEKCLTSVASAYNLKKHMEIHAGVKPYKCDECGASFLRAHYLKKHQRTHNDLKPFKCSQCPAAFKWHSSLECHKNAHAKMKLWAEESPHLEQVNIYSGAKPYKCEKCGMTFGISFHLKAHQKSHGDQNK